MSNSFLPFRTFQIQVSIENGVFHKAICATSAGGPYEDLCFTVECSPLQPFDGSCTDESEIHGPFGPQRMLIHSEIT